MSNDTPTTDKVRTEYQYGVTDCGCCSTKRPEDAAAFDRWLEAERARVAARTLRDFADSTRFPNHWILFRREEDGSGVTVSDLLRETAQNIENAARIARDHGGER